MNLTYLKKEHLKKNNYCKKIKIVKLEISKILNWILPRSLFYFTSINGLFKLNEGRNWIGSYSGIKIEPKFRNAFFHFSFK